MNWHKPDDPIRGKNTGPFEIQLDTPSVAQSSEIQTQRSTPEKYYSLWRLVPDGGHGFDEETSLKPRA